MAITKEQEKILNNMCVGAHEILLGTYLKNLSSGGTGGGVSEDRVREIAEEVVNSSLEEYDASVMKLLGGVE